MKSAGNWFLFISHWQESRDELQLKKTSGGGSKFKQDMVLVDKTVADRKQVARDAAGVLRAI